MIQLLLEIEDSFPPMVGVIGLILTVFSIVLALKLWGMCNAVQDIYLLLWNLEKELDEVRKELKNKQKSAGSDISSADGK